MGGRRGLVKTKVITRKFYSVTFRNIEYRKGFFTILDWKLYQGFTCGSSDQKAKMVSSLKISVFDCKDGEPFHVTIDGNTKMKELFTEINLEFEFVSQEQYELTRENSIVLPSDCLDEKVYTLLELTGPMENVKLYTVMIEAGPRKKEVQIRSGNGTQKLIIGKKKCFEALEVLQECRPFDLTRKYPFSDQLVLIVVEDPEGDGQIYRCNKFELPSISENGHFVIDAPNDIKIMNAEGDIERQLKSNSAKPCVYRELDQDRRSFLEKHGSLIGNILGNIGQGLIEQI